MLPTVSISVSLCHDGLSWPPEIAQPQFNRQRMNDVGSDHHATPNATSAGQQCIHLTDHTSPPESSSSSHPASPGRLLR